MVRKSPVELTWWVTLVRRLLSIPTRRDWPSQRSSTILATMITPSIMISLSSKCPDPSLAHRGRSGQLVYQVLRFQIIRYIEDRIIPVCTLQRFTYVGWEDTIVSGWGRLSSAGEVSDTLQWVKVPPVSDATCNQPNSYDGELTANMICAGKNRNTNTRRFPNIDYIRPIYVSISDTSSCFQFLINLSSMTDCLKCRPCFCHWCLV